MGLVSIEGNPICSDFVNSLHIEKVICTVCMYVCIYICLYVCVCMYACMHTCVCIFVCMQKNLNFVLQKLKAQEESNFITFVTKYNTT